MENMRSEVVKQAYTVCARVCTSLEEETTVFPKQGFSKHTLGFEKGSALTQSWKCPFSTNAAKR